MRFAKRKILFTILFAVIAAGCLAFLPVETKAQTDSTITTEDLGLSYGAETGLPGTDIRLVIARIIRVALGLLGIVALVLILYGGFVWMTAGGDEEKIQKAKKILLNAAIGLVIILSAYAIASFVINALSKATGYEGGGGEGGGGGGGAFANALYLTSMPGSDLGCGIRNIHPVVVFNRPVDLATVSGNLVIRTKDAAVAADGEWHYAAANRQNAIVFDPVGDCGVAGQTDCLAASTTYQIFFTNASNIKSQNGLSLTCIGNYKNSCLNNPAAEFTTGTGVDTEPPTISISTPSSGQSFAQGSTVPVEVSYTDNYGLQNLGLLVDGVEINTQSISGCKKFGTATLNWSTGSSATGTYNVVALATDNAGLSASDSRDVKLIPAHCFDTELNNGETQAGPPACGDGCGSCAGDSCDENSDCASGWCESGVCVDRMMIEGFTPTAGAASSTYVTVSGRYFGSDGGHVYFKNSSGDWTEAFVVNCGAGIDNWTSTQLVVKVPKDAATGPIRVITASTTGVDGVTRQFIDTTDDDGWGYNNDFTVNSQVLPGLCALKPNSGEPYDYTILLGDNFGSSEDTVLFGSSTSYIKSWATQSITARVPSLGSGAVAVKVSVDGKTSNALRYTVRESLEADVPIIESITPDHGAKGEYITITGKNFGTYTGEVWFKLNGDGEAKLGSFDFPDECEGSTWTDTQIIVKFPDSGVSTNQTYSVQVYRALDSVNSPITGVEFDLEAGSPAPGICAIDPASGPIPLANSSTMKIYGEYYQKDASVSTPYYWRTSASVSTTDGRAAADEIINEDDESAEVYPASNSETGPVVMKRASDEKIGNSMSFTVYNCMDNDNKCTTEGYKCCTKGSDAGVCKLESDICAGETRSTGYIWRFNTGPFPPSAKVVERCNAATDLGENLPSPSPSIQWTSGGDTDQYNVCRTALVNIEFSMKMLQSTVNSDNIKVYKCDDIPATSSIYYTNNICEHGTTAVEMQPLSYNLYVAEADEANSDDYISMSPVGNNWDTGAYYQVVLSDNLKAASTSYYYGDEIRYVDEQNLKATRPCGNGTAYCFIFRTDDRDCKLSKVIVTPYKYWTSILEAPMKYRILRSNADDAGTTLYYRGSGLSDQHCIMMNMNDFVWKWQSNGYFSDIYGSPTGTHNNMTQVSALANTVSVGIPGDSVPIYGIASSTVNSTIKTGSSPLTIDLSTPKVVDYWPNCLEACTNAQVGARFNILMSNHNLSDNSVSLSVCNDENCISTTATDITPVLSESDSRTLIVSFTDPDAELEPNTIYQVTLSHTGTSTYDLTHTQLFSGASSTDQSLFSRPMQTQFTWRFKTKSEKCVVDNVKILPELYYAIYIHDRKVYSAEARSSPDTCDANGQLLNAWNIDWNWESSSTSVATVQEFTTKGHNPACTANCVKKGSEIAYGEAILPLCGNGLIEAGEDCDPPVKNGDNISCTLNCLRPGNSSSTYCGNGTVENNLGEECEPTLAGESAGCKIDCTHSGSSASTGAEEIGASICGNGTVGVGEECDLGIDANYSDVSSAMNCSSNCLHIGTVLADDWCEDNAIDFGGYTEAEYTKVCEKAISQCGDGVVSPGEDPECEETDDPVENGCTVNCLRDALSLAQCSPTSSITTIIGTSEVSATLDSLPIVGWWKFDEGSGTTASDSSGNSHTGTITGSATYVDGVVGRALSFNGSSDYVTIANPTTFPDGLEPRTICAWGKTNVVDSSWGWLMVYGAQSLNREMTLGRRYATAIGGGYGNSISTANFWSVGTWHHQCLAFDGTTAFLYGDGSLLTSENKSVWNLQLVQAYIGRQISNSEFWNGAIDEVQVFSEALTADEVEAVYEYGLNGGVVSEPVSVTGETTNEGCTETGQYAGSSLLYSEPSVCGDEVVGIGEDPDCEIGLVGNHTFTDPWALAVGVGAGSPSGDPLAQSTDIKGTGQQTLETGTYTDSGTGEFKIMCGYRTDAECREALGDEYGLGENSCCYNMASLISTYPEKSDEPVYDVCPNTYIEAKFDRVIDENTLANGVFVAKGYDEGESCPSGELDVSDLYYNRFGTIAKNDGGMFGLIARAWHRAIGWFKNIFGYTASAARSDYLSDDNEVFCAINNYGAATVSTDYAMGKYSTSTVRIDLTSALDTNSDYAIILSRDVRDKLGVTIGNSVRWRFITGDEICTIANVAIDPPEYMFTVSGSSTEFIAGTTAENGQLIQPVFGYAWEYEWGPAESDIVEITDTTSSVNLVTAKNRNGEETLTVTTKITQNIIGVANDPLTGSADIAVFLCENPWPSSLSDFPFYDEDYDFSTYYCRDYGSPGVADDLPYVTTTYYDASIASSEYAKRYIFTNTDNKDAIGMQIFYNPKKLSIADWYANEGFSGGVGSLKIDGYDALGGSFNYYIDALKTKTNSSNTIYPNIYQFSLNNDATTESTEVFKQMITNLKFNKNVSNIAYCADDLTGTDINYSMPCANDLDCRTLADAANKTATSTYINNFVCMNLRDKLQRDYTRLKDLRAIIGNFTYGGGLVGAWSMNEISYGKVADDSGHGLDAVAMGSGVSVTTGAVGNAIHISQKYPASGDYSYLKLSAKTTIGDRPFTVGIWVKATTTVQQGAFISNTVGAGTNGFRVGHSNSLGGLYAQIGNSSSYARTMCSAANIMDGDWHHVVVVYEREVLNSSGNYEMLFYVDGELLCVNTMPSYYPGMTETYSTNPVKIGSPAIFANAFTADFDDARIYARALTAEEISDWYVGNLSTKSVGYPKMADSTYITGQALSVWQSAWGALSTAVGSALPTDPINKLAQAGTCYLPNLAGGYNSCYKDSDCASSSVANRQSFLTADNGDASDEGLLLNDGVLNGSVGFNTGKGHGQAFSFSGDASVYVTVPYNAAYNSNVYSISAWIYPTKKNTATIIKKGGSDDNGNSLGGFVLEYSGLQYDSSAQMHFNNGTIRFAVFPSSTAAHKYFAIDSDNPLTVNTWHHIVATFNQVAGTGALYIDGSLAGTTFRTPTGAAAAAGDVSTAINNQANMEIGASFNGLIDNVAYYTRPVAASEAANMRASLCVLHDSETGWSAEDRRFSFACNTSSYAYRYSYVSSTDSFLLRANLEQYADTLPANWTSFVKSYVGSWVNFTYGVCAADDEIASPYHVSCGDGVLGGTEECDPPGKTIYDTSACPSGNVSLKTCSNQCKWGTSSTTACRAVAGGSCGDGKIQTLAGETCDDGALNGTNGRCNTTCNGTAQTCGNGVLDTGEFCDSVVSSGVTKCAYRSGVVPNYEELPAPIYYFIVDFSGSMNGYMNTLKSQLTTVGTNFANPDTLAKMGIGTFANAYTDCITPFRKHLHQYATTSFYSAAEVSDIVNDSNFDNCSGGTLTGHAFAWFRDTILPTILADSDNTKRDINVVLITDGNENTGTTPSASTTIKDLYDNYGIQTYVLAVNNATAANFTTWATYGGTAYEVYPTVAYIPVTGATSIAGVILSTYYSRYCQEYNYYSGYSCAWNCNGFGGYCGDGIVQSDGGEECESDSTCTINGKSGTRKCTDCKFETDCTENTASTSGTCGDGTVEEDEACDRGSENGFACTPGTSLPCTYCSSDCKNVITVDATCGNGALDSGETCEIDSEYSGYKRAWLPYLFSWRDSCYKCNDGCDGWHVVNESNTAGSECSGYIGYCGNGIVEKSPKVYSASTTVDWEECDGSVTGCPACEFGKYRLCSDDCLCRCATLVISGSVLSL